MALSMTFNVAGNLIASGALGAGANTSANLDVSDKYGAQITVKNTPGGTIAATRGVRIDILYRYGTGPSDTTLATQSYTLPSAVASTAESITLNVGPGKYVVKLTNLDAANGVTVEATTASIDTV